MYGFTNGLQTIITHANTVQEWESFLTGLPSMSLPYTTDWEESVPILHMMERHLQDLKRPVAIFTHANEDDMAAFHASLAIEIIPQASAAFYQDAMYEKQQDEIEEREKAERRKLYDEAQKDIDERVKLFHRVIEARLARGEDVPENERHIIIENPYREPTIGEILGISMSDPYVSNRTPEEEEKMKERIEAAKKNGTLMPESWGADPLTEEKKKKLVCHDGLVITKDGEAVSGRGLYRAYSYDVDTEALEQYERDKAARDAEAVERLANLTYEDIVAALGSNRYDSVAAGQIILPDDDEEENTTTRREVSLGGGKTNTTHAGDGK